MIYFYKPLKKFYALTFDFDDTLYENFSIIQKTENKLVQFLKNYHPLLQTFCNRNYEYYKLELQKYEPDIYHNVSYWRWKTIQLIMKKFGINEKEAKVGSEETMKIFFNWRNKINISSDVHYTLSLLSKKWPMIGITNGNVDPNILGIAKYFQYIFYAGKDGRVKPFPDMYALASSKLNISAKYILHIGNDLNSDVAGSIQYGMQSCWINKKGKKNFFKSAITNQSLFPHVEISKISSLIFLLENKF